MWKKIIFFCVILLLVICFWQYVLMVLLLTVLLFAFMWKKNKEKERKEKDDKDIRYTLYDKKGAIRFLEIAQQDINNICRNITSGRNAKYTDNKLIEIIIKDYIQNIFYKENLRGSSEDLFVDSVIYLFLPYFHRKIDSREKYKNHQIREFMRFLIKKYQCVKNNSEVLSVGMGDEYENHLTNMYAFFVRGETYYQFIPKQKKASYTYDAENPQEKKIQLGNINYVDFVKGHDKKLFPLRLIRSLYPFQIISKIPFNNVIEGETKEICSEGKSFVYKIRKKKEFNDTIHGKGVEIEFILQSTHHGEADKWDDLFRVIFDANGHFKTIYVKDKNGYNNRHSADKMILSLLNFHFHEFNKVVGKTCQYRDMYCQYLIKSIYEEYTGGRNGIEYLQNPCLHTINRLYVIDDKIAKKRFLYCYTIDEANTICTLLSSDKETQYDVVIYFVEQSPFNNQTPKEKKALSITKFLESYSKDVISRSYYEEKILFLINELSQMPQVYSLEKVKKCYDDNSEADRNFQHPLPIWLVNDAINFVNSINKKEVLECFTHGEKFHFLAACNLIRAYLRNTQDYCDHREKNHAYATNNKLLSKAIQYWYNTCDRDVILSRDKNGFYNGTMLCNINIGYESIQFHFQNIKLDADTTLYNGLYNYNKPMQNIAAEVYMWSYYYMWEERCRGKGTANYRVRLNRKEDICYFLDMVYIKDFIAKEGSKITLKYNFCDNLRDDAPIDLGFKSNRLSFYITATNIEKYGW